MINYSERHLSPMACRLDERKKKKKEEKKDIHPSAQVVPTLWPVFLTPGIRENYRGRARHFPRAISTPTPISGRVHFANIVAALD